MSLPNDAYGRTITVQTTGNDSLYTITNSDGSTLTLDCPVSTPIEQVYAAINAMQPTNWVPSLVQCQTINLQNFNAALEIYSTSIYSLETQFRLFMLYYSAVQNGLTNRAAYLAGLFTWLNSIIDYAATYTGSVMAQTDPATALNMQWSFSGLSIPSIKLLTAIQIPN